MKEQDREEIIKAMVSFWGSANVLEDYNCTKEEVQRILDGVTFEEYVSAKFSYIKDEYERFKNRNKLPEVGTKLKVYDFRGNTDRNYSFATVEKHYYFDVDKERFLETENKENSTMFSIKYEKQEDNDNRMKKHHLDTDSWYLDCEIVK